MKYGFKTIPKKVDWPTLRQAWHVADQIDVFDSGWLNDHMFGRHGGAGQHEAMTLAAALAASTNNLLLGHHVLANVYRHPVLLAKIAATLDHVSAGRFIIGLGAGTMNPAETQQYEWPTGDISERLGRLAETIQILKGLWATPDAGFSFEGRFYHLTDAHLDPPPITTGGPPIWVGTRGRRSGMPIVARWADGLAITSDGWTRESADNLESFRELLESLDDACSIVGRDRASIDVCVRVQTDHRSAADVIDESRGLAANGATHLVFAFAANDGVAAVERLAASIVAPLRQELGD